MNIRMKKIILGMFLSALALSEPVYADNFRCPNGSIVSTGESQSTVAMKCDQPSNKSSRMQSEAGGNGSTILINIEEWLYNEGPNRLVHILTFRNGVLESVQTGGYGK